jgi:hypothetical protein
MDDSHTDGGQPADRHDAREARDDEPAPSHEVASDWLPIALRIQAVIVRVLWFLIWPPRLWRLLHGIYRANTSGDKQRVPFPAHFFSVPPRPMEDYLEGDTEVDADQLADLRAWLEDCEYAHDSLEFGHVDYWSHPNEFETRRRGDCDDHAVWAWREMQRLGIDAELVVGLAPAPGLRPAQAHAWVRFEAFDETWNFETTAKGDGGCLLPVDEAARWGYVPWFGIDQDLQVWSYSVPAPGMLGERQYDTRWSLEPSADGPSDAPEERPGGATESREGVVSRPEPGGEVGETECSPDPRRESALEIRDMAAQTLHREAPQAFAESRRCVKEFGGHVWLFLPRTFPDDDFSDGFAPSMLLGAEPIAEETTARLEGFVAALGHYLADHPPAVDDGRLPLTPQRLLDEESLQRSRQFRQALETRAGYGVADGASAQTVSGWLTSADAPEDRPVVDWSGAEFEPPNGFCELLEHWGPATIDTLELFGPEQMRHHADQLRDTGRVPPVWPTHDGFLPAAKTDDWYLGWRTAGEDSLEDWHTALLHIGRDKHETLEVDLLEFLTRQMTGDDPNREFPRIRPRVLPVGWPEPDWPTGWDRAETFDWYARAFRGTEREIHAAADFLADRAPAPFLGELLAGLDLGSDSPALPKLFRRGNGLLGLEDHQTCYIQATWALVERGAVDMEDVAESGQSLEVLDELDPFRAAVRPRLSYL